jgi:hypothetical protein
MFFSYPDHGSFLLDQSFPLVWWKILLVLTQKHLVSLALLEYRVYSNSDLPFFTFSVRIQAFF